MVKKLKELYNHDNADVNAERYAYELSNKTTDLLDKADIVADFLAMVEDIYYDMESGKDVLSNTYERNQFLAELEIADTVFADIYDVLGECQDVIKKHLAGLQED